MIIHYCLDNETTGIALLHSEGVFGLSGCNRVNFAPKMVSSLEKLTKTLLRGEQIISLEW